MRYSNLSQKELEILNTTAEELKKPEQKFMLYFYSGLTQLLAGDIESALKTLLLAREQNPKNLEVNEAIRDCYIRLNLYDKLLAHVEEELAFLELNQAVRVAIDVAKSLEAKSRRKEAYDFLLRHRELLKQSVLFYSFFLRFEKDFVTEEQWIEDAEAYLSSIENNLDREINFELALIYISRREYERAINHLSKIIKLYPEDLSVQFLLIDCLLRTGEIQQLTSITANSDLPEDLKVQLLFYIATEQSRAGNKEEALNLINEYLNLKSNILGLEEKRQIDGSDLELLLKEVDQLKDLFFLKYIACSTVKENADKLENAKMFSIFQKLLEKDSEDIGILKQLERFIDIEKHKDGLANLLEVESQLIKDKRLLSGIFLSLARYYISSKELLKARDSLNSALKIDPNNFNALKLLEKVLSELEDWHALIETIEKEIELIQDPKEVLYLYFRIGELYEKNLGNPVNAGVYYEKVLSLSPNYIPALRALRRVYTMLERWNDLIDILRREMDFTSDGSTLVELMLESASVYETGLGDLDSARKIYLEILESSPGNVIAIQAIKRISRVKGDYEGLRDILLKEVGFIEDSAIRADTWFELGELYENKFNDLDEALNCYTKAMTENNNYVPAYSAIESVLKKSGKKNELKSFYKILLEKIKEPEPQTSLFLKLAELSDDVEKASIYEQALKISPNNPELLKVVALFYERVEEYKKLVDIIDRLFESTSDDTYRSALMFKKGIILEKNLDDPEGALRAFEEAVERVPNLTDAWEGIIRIHTKKGQLEPLAKALKNYAAHSPSEKRATELLIRCGELYYHSLNNIDEAIVQFENVLKLDENNLTSMRALSELYRLAGRLEDAIRILSGYINFIETVNKKITEIKKLVVLFELAGEITQAINWLKEAHRLAPHDIGIIMKLEELLLRTKRWEDLLNVYDEHLKLNLPDSIQLEINISAGKIAWEALKNSKKAIEYLNNAIKIKEDAREALLLLDQIYTQLGDKEKLVSIIEQLIKYTEEPSEKVKLLRRAGNIYKEGGYQTDAIRVYEEILKFAEDDRDALISLDHLYLSTSQWQKQYKICDLLLKYADSKEDRAELEYKMGYAQVQLGDTKLALEHFNRALENLPSHVPSLKEKCKILRTKENFPLLSKSLLELARYLKDNRERSETLTEAGILLMEKLALEDEAIKVFEEAYSQNEENHVAVMHLTSLLFKKNQWEQLHNYSLKAYPLMKQKALGMDLARFLFLKGYAEEHLNRLDEGLNTYREATRVSPNFIEPQLGMARILLEKKDFRSAQEVLLNVKEAVEREGNRDKIFFVLLKLGISSYQLEDLNRSIEYLEAAKRIRSMDPDVLNELAGVYELLGNWERCALNLEEWLTLGIMEKRELYLLRLGKIYHENLKKIERAEECFLESISTKPDFLQGYIATIEFYQSQGRWKECAKTTEELLGQLKDKKERSEWLLKLAKIYYEKLNQPDKAVEIANKIISEGEATFEGYELLAEIYKFKEKWEEALNVYTKIKESAPSRELKIAALLNRGKILKEKLRQNNIAGDDFREVLSMDPKNIEARIALAEIYDADPSKVAESIREHHEIISLDPTYIPSYRSLGRHYESQREYDRAYRAYSALKIFNALDDMERVFLDSITSRAVKKLTTPVTEEIKRRDILHPFENLALRQMWLLIGEEIDDIYPPDIGKYGVTKNDLFPAKSPTDAVIAANETAEILGVRSFRLYRSKNVKTGVVENTSPRSIILPEAWIESMKIDELRFAIGVYMEYIASNNLLPLKLQGEGIKRFINLTRKCFYPELKISGIPDEEAQQNSKRIYKAFSRKTRNAIQEIIDKSSNEILNINFNDYLAGIRMSAIRVAFLFVNDLKIATKVIPLLTDGEPTLLSAPEGGILEILKTNPFLKDLFVYNISNRYFEVRRALKLSLLT